MKISSKVCHMLQEAYLHHIDLSNTIMNFLACKMLGNLIKISHRLQNLNLSNCALRGTSAREIVNALLFNQSLKFLNLSVNSLASKDYELGSKLARVIQVHQSLVHLDLTSVQIKREEAMYIAKCLKDSSNIVCCHLTGNSIDYYSRLYLRSHLNAIVQYPLHNNLHNQNTIMAADRGQVVALNNQMQTSILRRAGKQIEKLKNQQNEYYADVAPELNEDDQRRYLSYKQDQELIRGRRTLGSSGEMMSEEGHRDSLASQKLVLDAITEKPS